MNSSGGGNVVYKRFNGVGMYAKEMCGDISDFSQTIVYGAPKRDIASKPGRHIAEARELIEEHGKSIRFLSGMLAMSALVINKSEGHKVMAALAGGLTIVDILLYVRQTNRVRFATKVLDDSATALSKALDEIEFELNSEDCAIRIANPRTGGSYVASSSSAFEAELLKFLEAPVDLKSVASPSYPDMLKVETKAYASSKAMGMTFGL